MTMVDSEKLKNELRHFTGSETWHKWSVLYPKFLLTDGAKFLADEAQCYWLMDIIGSYQKRLLPNEAFQVWKLTVYTEPIESAHHNIAASVICEDGNNHTLIQQYIEFTDFPLNEIKLYFIWDGDCGTILLPSEY